MPLQFKPALLRVKHRGGAALPIRRFPPSPFLLSYLQAVKAREESGDVQPEEGEAEAEKPEEEAEPEKPEEEAVGPDLLLWP